MGSVVVRWFRLRRRRRLDTSPLIRTMAKSVVLIAPITTEEEDETLDLGGFHKGRPPRLLAALVQIMPLLLDCNSC